MSAAYGEYLSNLFGLVPSFWRILEDRCSKISWRSVQDSRRQGTHLGLVAVSRPQATRGLPRLPIFECQGWKDVDISCEA